MDSRKDLGAHGMPIKMVQAVGDVVNVSPSLKESLLRNWRNINIVI
jgi:hypothetical protein